MKASDAGDQTKRPARGARCPRSGDRSEDLLTGGALGERVALSEVRAGTGQWRNVQPTETDAVGLSAVQRGLG